MDFNEIAQWAAILFIGVFVFGLTRQLGVFLLPHSEQLAEAGPRAGRPLPNTLVPAGDLQQLGHLAASSSHGLAALVVVEEACPSCHELVATLESPDWTTGIPVAALMKECSDRDFRSRISEAFALVFDDRTGARTQAAGIIGTPYAMVVDKQAIVREKLVGPDVLERLRRRFGNETRPEEAHDHASQMETMVVGQGAS